MFGAQLRKKHRESEAARRGAGGGGGSEITDEALCRYELDMRLLQVRTEISHCPMYSGARWLVDSEGERREKGNTA